MGPVLTWTTDAMLGHVDKLLKLEGRLPVQAAVCLPSACCAAGMPLHRCRLCAITSCHRREEAHAALGSSHTSLHLADTSVL